MHALRVLEFDQVLERLAAHADTAAGRRAALALMPVFDPEVVARRVAETAEADWVLSRAPVSLAGVGDVGPTVEHCQRGGVADGASLHDVGSSLASARAGCAGLSAAREECPRLSAYVDQLPILPKLEAKLTGWLDGDGTVRDEASPELARLRAEQRKLAAKMQEKVRGLLSGKAREWLSDPIATTRNGRTVLPVKSEHRGKLKGIVHDTSASGHTVFVEPEELVSLGNDLRAAEALAAHECERVLRELSEEVAAYAPALLDGLEAATGLDLALACARHGHEERGCVPAMRRTPGFRLERARHPLLDRESAVPLSIQFSPEARAYLVTGPNTGGKTVALKTVGLCLAMAHCGLMPPASAMEFQPVAGIWADLGDEQSLSQSLSTFSGHIKNIAEALAGAQPGSLVLLDELGAGTDPAEGAGLARALLLEFDRRGAWVFASTHFGELKTLAAETPGFRNCSMEFDRATLRPTYRLLVGVPGSSQAMAVARRFGIPEAVVAEAESYLGVAEADLSRTIDQLAQARADAEAARQEALELAERLAEAEARASEEAHRTGEARRKAQARAAEEMEALLREIRAEAQAVFDELKEKPGDASREAARSKLRELQQLGREFVDELRPAAPAAPDGLQPGDAVRIRGHATVGTLAEAPRNGKAVVLVGRVKMTVAERDLERAGPPAKPAAAGKPRLGLGKAMTGSTEIHLRHMRAEDATEALDRFLDDAVLAGFGTLRIVHGKGGGVLRKLAHEALRAHRAVRSFRLGSADEGGDGVTVVTMR